MRIPFFSKVTATIILCITILFSCKDDSYLKAIPPAANQSFVEEFDTATAALSRGWKFINVSDPKGGGVWQNGGNINPLFSGFSNNGSYAGFIGTDYTSTSAAQGVISNWLLSPEVIMKNGDKIIFYTRSQTYFDPTLVDTTDYGNTLQVMINTSNNLNDVGKGTDAGSFTTTILTINPTLAYSSTAHPDPYAYPTKWTRFEATITTLPNPVKGKFGFRYYVTDGGSNGNGSGIGIDSVAFKSAGY